MQRHYSAAAAILIAAFLCGGVAAHDYAHPELKSWFMGLHNQRGSPCCDGDDAVHIEDQDWQTFCEAGTGQCHYQVQLEGKWYTVPDESVILTPNKTGTALVWPVRTLGAANGDYAIRCFMPGAGI
jgi:hypothetical protein